MSSRKNRSKDTKQQNKSYPHAIFHDFEAYIDKNKQRELTDTLTLAGEHVPISESVGDTLERKPTHICKRNPAELINKFVEELERRGVQIRTEVRKMYRPDDVDRLLKKQRDKINE